MAEQRPDRTLGPDHDEFWAWCGRGELRLQRCRRCRHVSWPAVPACERCASADLDRERMSGLGQVASACTFERDCYRGTLPIPWDTILVELEEGPLFLSNPAIDGGAGMPVGTPVRVSFLACRDKAGDFALPVFEIDPDTAARGEP